MSDQVSLLAVTAARFDALVKGELRDVLDELKTIMLEAVSEAYERGQFDAGSPRPARLRRTTPRNAEQRRHSAAIRAWAKANGVDVADRGRLPASVIWAYPGEGNADS